jgi:hypothetical protein
MIEKQYIQQLEKNYTKYLSDLVFGLPFRVTRLRGGIKKPTTVAALYRSIDSFLKHEKKDGKLGWLIEWESWQSKSLGNQRWPSSVSVESEADFLYLIDKQKEAALFQQLIGQLLRWRPEMAVWLAVKPLKTLELQVYWPDLCTVIDYLLDNNVSNYYIRSLPVPVHTKFLQQHQAILVSILKHLRPERFHEEVKTLDAALGLQQKPLFFPIRWLESQLAKRYTSGIEILSIPTDDLRKSEWAIEEVWLVENETNLFLLPQRNNAIAVFTKGYALHDLKDIPLFHHARLFYWGDLDEDGFKMLHQFRQYYPHTQSILMDDYTVALHIAEMEHVPFRQTQNQLNLTDKESLAYQYLMKEGGRIEQEKLKQDYIQEYLNRLD